MVKFESLWKSYPDKDKIKLLCTNKQKDSNEPFGNYCAILLSECFIRSGINISGFSGNKCWSHSGKKHILLAEDMAKSIKNHRPKGFGTLEKIDPNTFRHTLRNSKGIIFFKDYWQRGKETTESRSGDHIDLWNLNKISNNSMIYRSIIELFGFVSELNKSKEIWFWHIK